MRILIINQFFWPDLAPTAQYLADVTRHLAAQGHEVTVICSQQAYGDRQDEGDEPPPARVIRVGGFAFSKKALSRILSYGSFMLGAFWQALRQRDQDMILTMTTPPMLSVAGAMVKAVGRTRFFIWEMDVFPDALATTGSMNSRHPLFRLLQFIQRKARSQADGVLALGPCMKERLIQDGVPAERIHIVENWADGRTIEALSMPDLNSLQIMYSGNLGRVHDVATIADAIRYFRNDKRFTFVFAGGGEGRKGLQILCGAENIQNVKFWGFAKRHEMSEHLAAGHIGLVTELPACVGTVVPSKLYGILAAARPVLFIGPSTATPAALIERHQCGWQVDPGDVQSLTLLLERLADDREEILIRGRNARQAFVDHYDLPHGVARFSAALGLNSAPLPAEAAIAEVSGVNVSMQEGAANL